ncbi:hypothetical protein ACF1GW_29450 [Streptomyces achromogenes]|uniref:hypothetical protein n=1 Tax=Streptomyces achromogenes TaxID=67255 RepID=UPI00370351D8
MGPRNLVESMGLEQGLEPGQVRYFCMVAVAVAVAVAMAVADGAGWVDAGVAAFAEWCLYE